ncbi:MAG: diguanylate cyclase [Fibrobacterota bacterium]
MNLFDPHKLFRVENGFEQIIESLPDGVTVIDGNGGILCINPAFAHILGLPVEGLKDAPLPIPLPASSLELHEMRLKSVNGKPVDIEYSLRDMTFGGKPARLLVIRDITIRKERERRVHESEERYALAFRGSKDGLWDYRLRDKKIYFSPEWKAMLGFLAAELGDNPDEWFKRVHDQDHDRLQNSLQAHLLGETPHFECEYRILRKDFCYRWMLCRGTALRDAKGTAVRLTGSQIDITERKVSEEQLAQALEDLRYALASEKVLFEELDKKNKELTELSITDGLTRLYNHRFLQERFEFEFNRTKRYGLSLSCLLMDIDHFKDVNDTYGHQFGDYVLREIAFLIKTQSREVDICGRYGGEEFMIISNLILDDASRFAERLRAAVDSHTFTDNGITAHITFSIGVAEYRTEIKTKHEMIERSDQALYEAKDEGRNRVRCWREREESDEASVDAYGVRDLKEKFTQLSHRMRNTYVESTNALVNAIDAKDHYTREHSQNVARYAMLIAQALKLSEKNVEVIRNAGLLHDVGKIGIPQEVLLKAEALTPDEYDLLKQHSLIGVNILKDVKFLEKEIPIIQHHHERFDGSGYPHGLKGYEIPMGARILAVADAFDAMTTDRIYQKKKTKTEAVLELRKWSGRQFSPDIVECFIPMIEKEL